MEFEGISIEVQNKIEIDDCGIPGDIINGILQAALVPFNQILGRGKFKFSLTCGLSDGCTSIVVKAPVKTTRADIEVCVIGKDVI